MTQLLNLDHETGDTSQYSTVTDPDADFNISTPGLGGTDNAITVTIDDLVNVFGVPPVFSPTWTTQFLRTRFYFDPNSMSISAGGVLRLLQWNQSFLVRGFLELRNATGSQLQLRYTVSLDSGASTIEVNITDAPQVLEFRIKRADTAVALNGEITMYIDEVQVGENTGLDIFDVSRIDRLERWGASSMTGTLSGSFIQDEIIVTDDDTAIGASSVLTSISVGIRRRRRKSSIHR